MTKYVTYMVRYVTEFESIRGIKARNLKKLSTCFLHTM